MAHPLAVVAEDRLTQAVLHKCVEKYLPNFQILRSEIKGGRGNVQRELAAYANLAQTMPVLVGFDLDQDNCAPGLISRWQLQYPPHENLLVRVAVREVESWVLADRKRFSSFVGSTSDDIDGNPDSLGDPKRTLLDIARACSGDELKRDLVPRNYAQYPRIGPAYNLRMCDFVAKKWRPHVAMGRSDSLTRAITAIAKLGEE